MRCLVYCLNCLNGLSAFSKVVSVPVGIKYLNCISTCIYCICIFEHERDGYSRERDGEREVERTNDIIIALIHI